jgi:hypothetical protein
MLQMNDWPDKAAYAELTELLELVHIDWSIHDLDQYHTERMQTTLGRQLCDLLHQFDRQRTALIVAAFEMDALGDTDLHETAANIARQCGRDEPRDEDYAAAFIEAVDRLRVDSRS